MPERTRAGRIVQALCSQKRGCLQRDIQRDVSCFGARRRLAQQLFSDGRQLRQAERAEGDHTVNTAQQLRAERRPHRCAPAFAVRLRREAKAALSALLAADVRRHNNDRVFEVDSPAEGIGQYAVLENLQEEVRHIAVRLFQLVQQDDAVGPPPHLLRQDAALVVADVARRRADQARNGAWLHIFAHVDAHERVLRAEDAVCQRAAELRLAGSGRAGQKQRCRRALRPGESHPPAQHRPRRLLHGLRLTNDLFRQPFAQVQQPLLLGAAQLLDGDAGLLRDRRGDLLRADEWRRLIACGLAADQRLQAVAQLCGLLEAAVRHGLLQLPRDARFSFSIPPSQSRPPVSQMRAALSSSRSSALSGRNRSVR